MLAQSEALGVRRADAHGSDRLLLITDASPALPTPGTFLSSVMHIESCKHLTNPDISTIIVSVKKRRHRKGH